LPVDELDYGTDRIRRHRKIDLDAVDIGFEESANFLRDRVDRWHTVEQFGEGTVKVLVGTVEQWAKHKEARAELSVTVEVSAESQHLFELAANVARVVTPATRNNGKDSLSIRVV